MGARERGKKERERAEKEKNSREKKEKTKKTHCVVSATTKLGPLKSHFSWKRSADQPSFDAVYETASARPAKKVRERTDSGRHGGSEPGSRRAWSSSSCSSFSFGFGFGLDSAASSLASSLSPVPPPPKREPQREALGTVRRRRGGGGAEVAFLDFRERGRRRRGARSIYDEDEDDGTPPRFWEGFGSAALLALREEKDISVLLVRSIGERRSGERERASEREREMNERRNSLDPIS